MRYRLLDEIRGLTLISMILYHTCWDLVYMFHVKAPWYETRGAYYWQQSICWTFIILSGFCWHLGKNKLKHAGKIFFAGLLVTAVTLLFMPQDRIVFGVLTFLGTAAFIVLAAEKVLNKVQPCPGLLFSLCMFGLTKQVGSGYLGTGFFRILKVPAAFYRNWFTTFLGFPHTGFYSTDYFPVFPWIFLYIAGYYMYRWMERNDLFLIFDRSICGPVGVMGRHSLFIYLLHQPVLYLVFSFIFNVMA